MNPYSRLFMVSILITVMIGLGQSGACLHPKDNDQEHPLQAEWIAYKESYGKTYSGLAERTRRSVWLQNFQAVTRHNELASIGLQNYTLKVNHLADMDESEYVKKMVKLLKSRKELKEENMLGVPHHNSTEIPDELDWREEGYQTPIQNQQHCGSCYAFAIASMIEAQEYKKSGNITHLSVQQMVDCSRRSGNHGCGGGSFQNTLQYVKTNGLVKYEKYPYVAKESPCKYRKTDKAIDIKSWTILPPKDEYALKVALSKIGPIAISLNASPSTFQLYHKGIYDDEACTSKGVNHAMLLIGYTKNAWILKNWWSEAWGDHGYMYLKRGKNLCGISNFAAYALL